MALFSKNHNYTVHINPKSGCTFMKFLFIYLHWEEHEDDFTDEQKAILSEPNAPCTHYEKICLIKDIQKIWKSQPRKTPTQHNFVFTRDPYHRAVSMYVDKYARDHAPDTWGHENLPKDLSFNSFLDELIRLEPSDYEKSHFSSATICPESRNIGTIRLKCEDGYAAIVKHYGKYIPSIDLYKLVEAIDFARVTNNSSTYGNEDSDASNINFYHKDITHTKNSFLTEETKEKIFKLYKTDFRMFGYQE